MICAYFILLFSCLTNKYSVISTAILRKQQIIISKDNSLRLHKNRLRALQLSKKESIFDRDTIFLMEGVDVETSSLYCKIWSSGQQISYYESQNSLILQDKPFFGIRLTKLVESWDIDKIKKESKLYSKNTTSNISVIVTMVTKKTHRMLKIQSFSFADYVYPNEE